MEKMRYERDIMYWVVRLGLTQHLLAGAVCWLGWLALVIYNAFHLTDDT